MNESKNIQSSTTFVILGASGDLASKMTFPALFSLYCLGLLPQKTTIVGFGRSEMEDNKFKQHISKNFKGFEDHKKDFLLLCKYFKGKYNEEDFQLFSKELEKNEEKNSIRIFYLAIPPSSFIQAAKCIKSSAMGNVF